MLGEADQHGQIITIERHILEEQNYFPEATGTLTNLLYDIALAGKIIASKTNRAGLAEILGRTGTPTSRVSRSRNSTSSQMPLSFA